MMNNNSNKNKPSSSQAVLQKVKTKEFFSKKNKKQKKENTSSAATATLLSNDEDTRQKHNDDGSTIETPILSNKANKIKNISANEFPTLPDFQEDNVICINDDDDDDAENVESAGAIMSDDTHNDDNISLDNSFNSYVSDDDYYKQDYYNMRHDEVNNTSAREGADYTLSTKQRLKQALKKSTLNDVDETAPVEEEDEEELNDIPASKVVDDNHDVIDNIAGYNVTSTPPFTTQRKSIQNSTAAAEAEVTKTNTLSPNSNHHQNQSKQLSPSSKVSFSGDDDMRFNSNIKTPPHLNRSFDVFATPDNNNSSNTTDGSFSPITPLEELKTPGGSTNVPKVLNQNKKLRAGRKELLKMLGSTAKQLSAYEKVASQKIFELEERLRVLEKERQEITDKKKEEPDVIAWANENELDEDNPVAPDATETNDSTKGDTTTAAIESGSNNPMITPSEEWAKSTCYDPETVRNLSKEVMAKEKQLCIKEKFISSLKLRCETLKHCLSEKEDELEVSTRAWEMERKKWYDKLQADSPMRRDQDEISSLKMENSHLKKELAGALNDVDMLSDALEKNNEALDNSVSQLERLRKWKIEHDGNAGCEPLQSIDGVSRDVGEGKEAGQKIDYTKEETIKEMESTLTEKEQCVIMLEGSLKEKSNEILQLQTDLDSCFKEIESLKELVNKTAAAKGYEDFQNMVENLQDDVIKSQIKASAFNERISELEAEIQEKNTEIVQLSKSHESPVEEADYDYESPSPKTDHIRQSNHQTEKNKTRSLSPVAANDAVDAVTSSNSSSPVEESRRGSGLSYFRAKLKEGRQYAAAVGNSGSPESMAGMIRERDRKINSLEAFVESNAVTIEKLKKDIERMDTEHEQALMQSTQKIEQLEEENDVYLQQVQGFEKAFMTLNESQQSSLLPLLDNEAATPDESGESDNEVASDEEPEDPKSQSAKLERIVTQLRDENSFQEDQIEKLKTELTTLRVVSHQLKESALDKLRDENKIIEAQRNALESQLLEINRSAALLRDSISSSSPSGSNGTDCDKSVGVGSDPILVARVVMLENANKVLESSVDSLRSGQQEKLAPLLEKIALLEEEKRMMEEEMHTKVHCREQTISNLEESLKQATQSRLHKKKQKKASVLKLSEQLLARATKATKE